MPVQNCVQNYNISDLENQNKWLYSFSQIQYKSQQVKVSQKFF